MGLSFHYSGSIAKPELLSELICEIEDIAYVLKWKYSVYERLFPENTFEESVYNQNIYGISFTPPECETISICFLSNGRMSSNLHLKFFGKTNEQPEKEYLYMLSVKTQFASVELHQFIIELFRYISNKYLIDFKLKDDGGFWETQNKELLQLNFKKNAELIQGFSSAFEFIPPNQNETIKAYFERIIEYIRKKQKE